MESNTNVEKQICFHFDNRDLLKEALTAAGSKEQPSHQFSHDGANKALAMVGDALIRLVIVDDWYAGQGSRSQCEANVQKLACNEFLSGRGHEAHFEVDIFKDASQKGAVAKKTMATTVEAVVGAAWYDSGKNIEVVREILKKAIGHD